MDHRVLSAGLHAAGTVAVGVGETDDLRLAVGADAPAQVVVLVPRHQRAGVVGERRVVERAFAGDVHRSGERLAAVLGDVVDEALRRRRIEHVAVFDQARLDVVLAARPAVADRGVAVGHRRGRVGVLRQVGQRALDQLGRPGLLLGGDALDAGDIDQLGRVPRPRPRPHRRAIGGQFARCGGDCHGVPIGVVGVRLALVDRRARVTDRYRVAVGVVGVRLALVERRRRAGVGGAAVVVLGGRGGCGRAGVRRRCRAVVVRGRRGAGVVGVEGRAADEHRRHGQRGDGDDRHGREQRHPVGGLVVALPADEDRTERAGDRERAERRAHCVGELRGLAGLQTVDPADPGDPREHPPADGGGVDRQHRPRGGAARAQQGEATGEQLGGGKDDEQPGQADVLGVHARSSGVDRAGTE